MDGQLAIEHNFEALKRILASLVAMAGLAKGAVAGTAILPRHLRLAILRLLRPAEAAARRLIIALALAATPQARNEKTLVATLPPQRARKPKPAPTILRNGVGTGIMLPRTLRGTVTFFPRNGAAGSGPDASGKKANCALTPRPFSLPLLDPLPRWRDCRRPVATGVPRICLPGYTQPFPVSPRRLPSPDDPIDASRLARRIAALGRALDDLPGQARRFMRWQAARDAAVAQNRCRDAAGGQIREHRNRSPGRIRHRRIWPLRPGRPPGSRRRNAREVDEVLTHAHALAVWALERANTS